jgi:hypothetical protein
MTGKIFERGEQRIMNVEDARLENGLQGRLRAGARAERYVPLFHLSLYPATSASVSGHGRKDLTPG